LLAGKRIALLFEKESLRTRMTFDIGIQELGGSAIFLDLRDQRMGSRESVHDMAKNLERWVDGIVARTYRHRTVTDLAKHASIPVINGLSDLLHPCQALADTLTLTERWGSLEGRKVVFVGDGNNTCHSLMMACAKLGAHFIAVGPEGGMEADEIAAFEAAGFRRVALGRTILRFETAAIAAVAAVRAALGTGPGVAPEAGSI
jgi:ornithine carbamoyltransferase